MGRTVYVEKYRKKTCFGKEKNLYFISICCLFVVVILVSLGNMDTDVWHILTSGREIYENGIPYTNVHSVYDGLNVVIQQWGYNLFCYWGFSLLGWTGLRLIIILMFPLFVGLLNWFLSIRRTPYFYRILILFLSFFSLYVYWSIRPFVWSLSLLLLECIGIEKYIQTKKLWWLLMIPLSVLLEINTRASFWLFHFLFLAAYLVPFFKDKTNRLFYKMSYRKLPLVLAGVLSVGSLFLNPYGLEGIKYLFISYLDITAKVDILELSSIPLLSEYSTFFFFLFILTLLVMGNKKVQISYVTWWITLGMLVLSATVIRNTTFAFFGFLYLLTDSCVQQHFCTYAKSSQILQTLKTKKITKTVCGVFVLILILVVGASKIGAIKQTFSGLPMGDGSASAYTAKQYLDKHCKNGKVYTDFNTGGYLMYSGYRIYMESRPELYSIKVNKKKDILTDYSLTKNGNAQLLKQVLDETDCQFACIDSVAYRAFFETSPEWTLIVQTPEYRLYQQNLMK